MGHHRAVLRRRRADLRAGVRHPQHPYAVSHGPRRLITFIAGLGDPQLDLSDPRLLLIKDKRMLRQIGIVTLRGRLLQPAAQAFVKLLRARAASIKTALIASWWRQRSKSRAPIRRSGERPPLGAVSCCARRLGLRLALGLVPRPMP